MFYHCSKVWGGTVLIKKKKPIIKKENLDYYITNMEYETNEYILKYRDNILVKQLIFEKLLEFFKKHETFNGESICQCDDPQIESIELLSNIADELFQFKVEFK